MNYFSHYYVLPSYDDAYLALGSILPDMVRNAKTEFLLLSTENEQNKRHNSLTKGIYSHIEIDKSFHNSVFFLENTKNFASQLRMNSKIGMSKYTQFYAHILIELLLDHWLITQYSNLLDQFYRQLQLIDHSEIDAYFNKYLPSQDVELFWERLQKFMNRQYLKDYHSLNSVVGFSFYVYEKATKQIIDKEELNHYILLINDDFLPIIEKSARNLFETITS